MSTDEILEDAAERTIEVMKLPFAINVSPSAEARGGGGDS